MNNTIKKLVQELTKGTVGDEAFVNVKDPKVLEFIQGVVKGISKPPQPLPPQIPMQQVPMQQMPMPPMPIQQPMIPLQGTPIHKPMIRVLPHQPRVSNIHPMNRNVKQKVASKYINPRL